MLEPCFTADTLAEVLQMPVQKTLLRRHLSSHFSQLLGNEVIVAKREVLAQPYVLLLTSALKVKVGPCQFVFIGKLYKRASGIQVAFFDPENDRELL